VIVLALVNNRPEVLSLKQILHHFLEHRREVVDRRTIYEPARRKSAHILEGLKIALDNLDAVIALIRRSQSPDEARAGLMRQFSLTDLQANAILDMRLQRLTQLERAKLVEEYQEVLKRIEYLKSVLASEALVRSIIKDELTQLREEYKDDRKTQIVKEEAELSLEDLIAEEEVVVTISHAGYIKRNAASLYRAQRRGGKQDRHGHQGRRLRRNAVYGVDARYAPVLHRCRQGLWLKVHEIPEASRGAKGKALVNLLALTGSEGHRDIAVKDYLEDRFVVMATKNGLIKKTEPPPTAIHGRAVSSRSDWKTATNSSACRLPMANGRFCSVQNRASPSAFWRAMCGPWDGQTTASKALRSRKATR
jgi:DNA gyrase subunit A